MDEIKKEAIKITSKSCKVCGDVLTIIPTTGSGNGYIEVECYECGMTYYFRPITTEITENNIVTGDAEISPAIDNPQVEFMKQYWNDTKKNMRTGQWCYLPMCSDPFVRFLKWLKVNHEEFYYNYTNTAYQYYLRGD